MLYDFAQVRAVQPGADPELTQFITQASTTIGTPQVASAAYRARSPLYSASALSSFGGSLLVVHGAPQAGAAPGPQAHDATLRTLLAALPLKQAVALAVELTGAPRNSLYERALALKRAADTP